MLATPSQTQPYRRGHTHKRSAAISGDFDLDFFKQQPPITQQLYCQDPHLSTPSTPVTFPQGFKDTPVLTITEPETTPNAKNRKQQDLRSFMTSTSSPKKHTRLNSWAHTSNRPKKQDKDYSSSSSETTPELKRQAVTTDTASSPTRSLQQYQVPEALIDLDLASGIYRDPSTSTKSPTKKIQHRRTESAPELEDFLKYKIFNTSSSQRPSRKNSAIFEEDEDDENYRETCSNASSTTNLQLNKNPSLNSLGSSYSSNLLPPSRSAVTPTIQSTPNSMKSTSRRANASAARYQSYYNNLLISNALKSSESLSQVTNGSSSMHKSSYSSFRNNAPPSSGSSTSINSSVPNSPKQFKFESQIYDILPSDEPKPLRLHKKSNSLVNMMNKLRPTKTKESFDSEYEGDSTLTPLNLGEPGPAIDLTKFNRNDTNENINNEMKVNNDKQINKKKPEELQKKKRFSFGWRKK